MDVLAFVVPVVILIGTVAFMEVFAWWVHKYIMHGEMGWGWHKSHHEAHDPGFEKNDLYTVIFGVFAIGLFFVGSFVWQPLWWVAVGITVYGVLYFVAHDGLVHQRWPFRYIPRKGLPEAALPGPSAASCGGWKGWLRQLRLHLCPAGR